MRVGYYGYDNAFRNLFPLIIKEAEDMRGNEKGIWLPPQVRGIAVDRKDEMRDCDVVLLGLSSFQTQEELELIEACRRVVIIADVPGSELRPKAREWVQAQQSLPKAERKLKGLLLALESSRSMAIDFGYPPEDIYFVGVPPHWGVGYRQMRGIDISSARSRVTIRHGHDGEVQQLGDKFLLFIPGGKNPRMTNILLQHSIAAGRGLIGVDQMVIGFTPHPGERPEKPEEEEIFAEAFVERGKLLAGLSLADMKPFTNPERYAIAHLVVTTGGPTETISAAYARNTNVVYYRDDAVTAFLAESGVKDGKWFVPDYGGAHLVGPDGFLDGVRFAMSNEGKEYILRKQEENFPLPETWDTAPAIVDFLEKAAAM